MRRVVFNQKGGVGKTTMVANLAALSAACGLRTLAIDLDVQGNLSQYLLGNDRPGRNAADFFESTLGFSLQTPPFSSYAVSTRFEGLDVVAADPRLEEMQVKLETKQKVRKLRQALDRLTGYDAVWIDTPPAFNFYSRSALIAADRCLIPFDCDAFSRQALYTLLDNIQELRADHNEALEIEGIIINQYQSRAKLPVRLVAELKAEGRPVLDPPLSSSVKIRESHECQTPLIHMAPSHRVTLEYQQLYDHLAGATS
ncbi:MAG: ParA family protein [Nevskiaceae bacterium]|nr:MAG: ParA family protein [Nevskiaceae bacterium]TBR74878.1 MAG: ParA family protein [Nevskiaceae bacterium]